VTLSVISGRTFYIVRACSHQPRVQSTIRTTESVIGTSTRTSTTVASAASDCKPKSLISSDLAKLAGLNEPDEHVPRSTFHSACDSRTVFASSPIP
jgi:hypothetical protein